MQTIKNALISFVLYSLQPIYWVHGDFMLQLLLLLAAVKGTKNAVK